MDGLEKHYERADVDAQRAPTAATTYEIKTQQRDAAGRCAKPNTRKEIKIDGQTLKVKSASGDHAAEDGRTWKVDKNGHVGRVCTRRMRCRGRSTMPSSIRSCWCARPARHGTMRSISRRCAPWRVSIACGRKYFRGHPFVKDDKDVTEADMAKYHVVLFGDPGQQQRGSRR